MPIKLDAMRVGYAHDGRRKITDEQRQAVRRLYEIEGKSIHSIAHTTGVSKRSVQFILFPERLEVVKARAIEVKRWEAGNKKEVHTPVMQKHRAKKKELLERGLLGITTITPLVKV